MTEKVLNKHKAKIITLNMTMTITIIWQEHEHDSTLHVAFWALCVSWINFFCFNQYIYVPSIVLAEHSVGSNINIDHPKPT